MSDELLDAFESALIDGRLESLSDKERADISKEYAAVSRELAVALLYLGHDWGYGAATGPWEIAPIEAPSADPINITSIHHGQSTNRQAALSQMPQ